MKIYRVGGAVRDQLLGLPVQDEDFVVVGATIDEMIAQGFIPVGKDFPVFLHPTTHQEYALARTERKSGRGYKGFHIYAAPEVSLIDDLARRDLTINAMAEDVEGQLIDPFQGQQDLKNGVLRHVSPAFVEDPVRILRVARFAARFQFSIAPETMQLMQQMVMHGEVAALVPERVWQEISRGLMESTPSNMFDVLIESGALNVILPELTGHITATLTQRLNHMAACQESLSRRFSALTFSLSIQALDSLGQRLRVPQDILAMARLVCQEKAMLAQVPQAAVDVLLQTLLRCDAIRRGERFKDIVAVIQWSMALPTAHGDFLLRAARLLQEMDQGAIAKRCVHRGDIPHAIYQAQRMCVAKVIKEYQTQY